MEKLALRDGMDAEEFALIEAKKFWEGLCGVKRECPSS